MQQQKVDVQQQLDQQHQQHHTAFLCTNYRENFCAVIWIPICVLHPWHVLYEYTTF